MGLRLATFWSIGLTGKEAVELHQELEIDIVALGRLAMAAPNVVTIKVDTCGECEVSHKFLYTLKGGLVCIFL